MRFSSSVLTFLGTGISTIIPLRMHVVSAYFVITHAPILLLNDLIYKTEQKQNLLSLAYRQRQFRNRDGSLTSYFPYLPLGD